MHSNQLQYSCLGNPTDKRSLEGHEESDIREQLNNDSADLFYVSQTGVPGNNLLEEDTWLKGGKKKIMSSMVKHIGENLHPNFSLSLKIHNTCSISAAFEESHKKGSVVPLFNPISQISKDPPHC